MHTCGRSSPDHAPIHRRALGRWCPGVERAPRWPRGRHLGLAGPPVRRGLAPPGPGCRADDPADRPEAAATSSGPGCTPASTPTTPDRSTWHQRAWAAVLYAAPAATRAARSALSGARRASGMTPTTALTSSVAHDREAGRPSGRADPAVDEHYDRVAQMNLSPPTGPRSSTPLRPGGRRCARPTTRPWAVPGRRLSDPAHHARRVSPTSFEPRQGCRAEDAPRDPRDVAGGTPSPCWSGASWCTSSVLTAARAGARIGARRPRVRPRDVEYVEQALLVELDGRFGHELSLDRWDDLNRDIVAAATGRLTLRAGWAKCSSLAVSLPAGAGCSRRADGQVRLRPCGPNCRDPLIWGA